MWQNAGKHAKSFGVKGFLYGAAIGAVVGVAALLMVAGAISSLGAMGIVASTLPEAGLTGMASVGAQILANGLSALTVPAVAFVAGAGAAAGSFIGAVCSATAGSVYGAATDESNPLPRVIDTAATKIMTKSPELAKAIAYKVGLQEEAGQQLAAQGGAQTAPEAPMITKPIPETSRQQPAASFQERVATQTKEAELAAAQR